MMPRDRMNSHSVQNSGMVTDHTSMHHRHRVKSSKKLWLISQMQNASAPATPTANVIQNQRANRAPASSATPTAIGATNPAKPMIGIRETEDLTLPRLEVHAAVHEEREVAVEIGFDALDLGLEHEDLVEDEVERRPPPEHSRDDEDDRHRQRCAHIDHARVGGGRRGGFGAGGGSRGIHALARGRGARLRHGTDYGMARERGTVRHAIMGRSHPSRARTDTQQSFPGTNRAGMQRRCPVGSPVPKCRERACAVTGRPNRERSVHDHRVDRHPPGAEHTRIAASREASHE